MGQLIEKSRSREGGRANSRIGSTKGFTLIELIFVMIVLGLIAALALPKAQQIVEHAKVARAIGDIKAIQTDIDSYAGGNDSLPTSLANIGRASLLDPWGRPYVYNNFSLSGPGVPSGARRDRFLVPVNSTYDLYSVGKDGSSVPPLGGGPSQDDIVRANDGGFIGRASLY